MKYLKTFELYSDDENIYVDKVFEEKCADCNCDCVTCDCDNCECPNCNKKNDFKKFNESKTKKIIAYSLLNCGDAVIIYEQDGVRSKHVEKNADRQSLMQSGGKSVSKMEDIDKYLSN